MGKQQLQQQLLLQQLDAQHAAAMSTGKSGGKKALGVVQERVACTQMQLEHQLRLAGSLSASPSCQGFPASDASPVRSPPAAPTPPPSSSRCASPGIPSPATSKASALLDKI